MPEWISGVVLEWSDFKSVIFYLTAFAFRLVEFSKAGQ